jgi:hypothetical protein
MNFLSDRIAKNLTKSCSIEQALEDQKILIAAFERYNLSDDSLEELLYDFTNDAVGLLTIEQRLRNMKRSEKDDLASYFM